MRRDSPHTKAKEEEMNIAIQWQDADSSVTDPDAEVMICGGHASRAHKNQVDTGPGAGMFLREIPMRAV